MCTHITISYSKHIDCLLSVISLHTSLRIQHKSLLFFSSNESLQEWTLNLGNAYSISAYSFNFVYSLDLQSQPNGFPSNTVPLEQLQTADKVISNHQS